MCKTDTGKTLTNLFTIITDVCAKIAFLETCFEQNTKESVVEAFKNISRVEVQC